MVQRGGSHFLSGSANPVCFETQPALHLRGQGVPDIHVSAAFEDGCSASQSSSREPLSRCGEHCYLPLQKLHCESSVRTKTGDVRNSKGSRARNAATLTGVILLCAWHADEESLL